MVKLLVSVNSEAWIASAKGFGIRFRQGIGRALTKIAIQVQRRVKEKLSGEVLNVRTGTLRRSINYELKEKPGMIVASVGTNVKYAGIHEFGYTGPETIKAHLRMMRTAFGKPVKDPRQIMVRAHVRNVKLPERSFLRSTLREFDQIAQADIRQAAIEAMKKS